MLDQCEIGILIYHVQYTVEYRQILPYFIGSEKLVTPVTKYRNLVQNSHAQYSINLSHEEFNNWMIKLKSHKN